MTNTATATKPAATKAATTRKTPTKRTSKPASVRVVVTAGNKVTKGSLHEIRDSVPEIKATRDPEELLTQLAAAGVKDVKVTAYAALSPQEKGHYTRKAEARKAAYEAKLAARAVKAAATVNAA